jgi:hypothetical protein
MTDNVSTTVLALFPQENVEPGLGHFLSASRTQHKVQDVMTISRPTKESPSYSRLFLPLSKMQRPEVFAVFLFLSSSGAAEFSFGSIVTLVSSLNRQSRT